VSANFTETNLIPNAGLLPAAMLAQRIDLPGLVDERVLLADHGANCGSKAFTVIGSILPAGTASTTPRCSAPGRLGRCSTTRGAPSTVG
jgi:hypothetical protein